MRFLRVGYVLLLLFIPAAQSYAQDSLNVTRTSVRALNWNRAMNVAVVDELIYVASDWTGFRILNASDPENPFEIGSFETPGIALEVAVQGDYAYIADDSGGFWVFDISNPFFPTSVAVVEQEALVKKVRIYNNYAFMIESLPIQNIFGRIHVLDINDPENPEDLGVFEDQTFCHDIVFLDDQMIVSVMNPERVEGLWFVDISDPANPVEVEFFPTGQRVTTLAHEGDFLYGAEFNDEFRIFDISDFDDPNELGSIDIPDYPNDIVVENGLAYVAFREAGLQILDVSNPNNPVLVSDMYLAFRTLSLQIRGETLYSGVAEDGVRIVDVSNPEEPVLLSSYNQDSYLWDVLAVDDIAFLANGNYFLAYDRSNPGFPVPIGSCPMPEGTYQRLSYSNNTAWIVSGNVKAIDVSDPQNPTVLNPEEEWIAADGVAIGDILYQVDSRDLEIYDITDPSDPILRGEIDPTTNAANKCIDVENGLACVGTQNQGFVIVDVSNPQEPLELGTFEDGLTAVDITVSGNFVYIIHDFFGFSVVDISDPMNPVQRGTDNSIFNGQTIKVYNQYVFVTDLTNGVFIYNVTDPDELVQVGFYDPVTSSHGFSISPPYLYNAEINNFAVYDFSEAVDLPEPEITVIPLLANRFELVSSNRSFDNPSAESVFGGIAGLTIALGNDGVFYIPDVVPGNWNVDVSKGYKLFCIEVSEWRIGGDIVDQLPCIL